MDEMVAGEGLGPGDWVWRRRGSGNGLHEMLAGIGSWSNGMSWGMESWGEDLHCLMGVGSEKRDRPQQVL